jgi:hypothetical protein
LFLTYNSYAKCLIILLFSNFFCLFSSVFDYSFFACRTFHRPLDIAIACHCNSISIPASFGSGNVALASFSNNKINEGRWTQDKHKIFLQEYERSMAIIACKLQKFSAHKHPLKLKKHAECFFKQNLKNTSAAVKQYQESLSPNGKARVMVKHAAQQQKYQQFLSPEDKTRMPMHKKTMRVPSF